MTPNQDATPGRIADERAVLPIAQGVLLWSMRAWVLGQARATDMAGRIRAAFAGVGAPDAAPALAGFMEALDENGIRTIDVERMCSPVLSADERLLLGAFAALGRGDTAVAARVLRGMASSRGVAASLGRAEDVVGELTDAGHVLDDAEHSRRPGGATVPAPALAVLH